MKIGLLGLGTVGGGVVNLLRENGQEINRRIGVSIDIHQVCVKDINKKRICDTSGFELTTDPFAIVNNPEIDVVLELMGGTLEAKVLVRQAIANGKHVVTANKALLANDGNELIEQAHNNKVELLFEAAVAGGIPIINVLKNALVANRIDWLVGIINGTGNFILSEMKDKDRPFDDVLKEAQQLGYAEQDPTFDVEGIDAAQKLSILSALAFGTSIDFDYVFIEGIRSINPVDVGFADELGYTIKHLGIAKQANDLIEMRVHPTLLPNQCLLANVNGVMNAVVVNGNALGPTLYYGAGAGDNPTASAVVADVISLITNTRKGKPFSWQQLKQGCYQTIENVACSHYLRLDVADKTGVLADITQILAQHDISVETVIQKKRDKGQDYAMIALVTGRCVYHRVKHAIAEIETHDFIGNKVVHILVETLH